jgi:hypothetical protein
MTSEKKNGHAMPHTMLLRYYFAANAPVSYVDARALLGEHFDATRESDRQKIIALLVRMRREYADAMIAELEHRR